MIEPMIEQDFLMLIMNCKKYIKKAQFQKNTWLPKIPSFLKYYHVIGDPELETEFKFDNETQTLWVKVEDDYNSLPKKVISAYNATVKTFNFKYIFKTDDDQVLNTPNFFDVLTKVLTITIPRIHYGGHIVDVKKPYLSQYSKIHPELPKYLPILQTTYCSGRFYLLSNVAILNLLSKSNTIMKELLEDYAIGYHLDPSYKINILPLTTNKYFTDIEVGDL